MNQTLMEQWIKVSHRWTGRIDPQITLVIQSLGRQNEQLAAEELRFHNLSDMDKILPENIPVLDNVIGLSRLWIFGCYELVRTFDQYSKENGLEISELTSLKHRIGKLRMPLAKFEKPGNKKQRTAITAALDDNGKIGWIIEQGLFVSRQEIAEATLHTLLLKI